MFDEQMCEKSLSILKVIVNQKNNVPFHIVMFYNGHVQFVILLKSQNKFIYNINDD